MVSSMLLSLVLGRKKNHFKKRVKVYGAKEYKIG